MAVGKEINGDTVKGIWASNGWEPERLSAPAIQLHSRRKTHDLCTSSLNNVELPWEVSSPGNFLEAFDEEPVELGKFIGRSIWSAGYFCLSLAGQTQAENKRGGNVPSAQVLGILFVLLAQLCNDPSTVQPQ